MRGVEPAQRGGAQREQQLQADLRDPDSGEPAERGQQQPLGRVQPKHAAGTRAEREPHRRLVLPRGGARDEQTRDVHTRNDEQQGDAAKQHQDRRLHVAHGLGMQRHAGQAQPALAVEHVLAADVRTDARDLGLRLREGDVGPHARDDAQEPLTARSLAEPGRLERQPRLQIVRDVRVRRHHRAETGRHDADDGPLPVADADRAADDRGIAAEAPLPQRMGENHRRCGAFVGRRERAAVRGAGAEHVEEVSRDETDPKLLGILARDHRGVRPDPADTCERRRALAQVVQLRGGERHAPEASAGEVVADEQQLFSVPEREVFEEHRVHEAEDRRRGADAEAERENRE